jgi:molecular chaperone GrpE
MAEETQSPAARPPTGSAPVPAAPPAPEPEPELDWPTRYKYLLADFENFRRRADREREGARQTARAELVRSLLPLFEASERAEEAVGHLEPSDPIRTGVELLARSWRSFFEGQRVTSVARPGARFESDSHEAVAEAAPSARHPPGTISEVVQQGYRMGPMLLRPAKVVVVRVPATPEEPTPAEAGDDSAEGGE